MGFVGGMLVGAGIVLAIVATLSNGLNIDGQNVVSGTSLALLILGVVLAI